MIAPERFVLEALPPDGGVLLDLESGILFELNPTALLIWQCALAGLDRPATAQTLVNSYEVSPDVARRDVDAALSPPREYSFAPRQAEFLYESFDGRYRMSAGGIPLVEFDPSRRLVRALSGFVPSDAGIYLRSVAPKLVAFFGASVLHASAVARSDGAVTAFLGESGAGKTTTARAFAKTGSGHGRWRLVSEDKLVLRHDSGCVRAALEGETRITNWVEAARKELSGGQGATCDATELAQAADGTTLPIDEVILVDVARRQGFDMKLRILGPIEAARGIFHHGFYGSADDEGWRRQLQFAGTLARTARTHDATMPDGTDRLEGVASRYREMTAS